jgi:putative acetyltransferase
MIVRREQDNDVAAVRVIVKAAFGKNGGKHGTEEQPEPIEVGLLDQLREHSGWIPELSLVAVEAGTNLVIGHVVCTRAEVEGTPALGLGPLAVRPDRQRTGVGTALMHAMIGAAEARGEALIGLLGNPAYYGRFGFRPSTEFLIDPPDPEWGRYFQIRTLTAGSPVTGAFSYAKPFQDL